MMVLILFSKEDLLKRCGYRGCAQKGTVQRVGYRDTGPIAQAWVKLLPDMEVDCPWLPPRTFKYLKVRS